MKFDIRLLIDTITPFIDVPMLILSLGLILFSCLVFTNAIEWFGKKLNIGEGVVGSVFAAIGTALPETVIPIIAIIFYSGENSNQIGIGAIAGAPFMLGTLAFFITGLTVIIGTLLGNRNIKMNVNLSVISRDLKFFIVIYGIAVLTSFLHADFTVKAGIAAVLIGSYCIYLRNTFNDNSEQIKNIQALYFARILKAKTKLFLIVFQLLIALIGIILGAHLFVGRVESLATFLDITPLILSIIITPIATELPEKLNSIIWITRKKDTLALGNITGAMVFQSCIPVVFGMLLTPWNLTGITMLSAVIALVSATLNLGWIKIMKTINPFVLMLSGFLYVIFLNYLLKIF